MPWKSWLWLVLVCSLAGWAEPPAWHVIVYLHYDRQLPEPADSAMRHEADSLLAEAGVRLNWRLIAENRGDEAFPRVVRVRVKGNCERVAFEERRDPFSDPVRLASAHTSGGRFTTNAEIECDAVARLMSRRLGKQRRSLLGIALGRLLAHELYHILARSAVHGREGLGKSTITLKELLSQGFEFDADEIARIRQDGEPLHPEGVEELRARRGSP